MAYAGSISYRIEIRKRKEERKTTQALKTTPHIDKEREPQ
jgi:hypothetical protein